MSKELTTGRGGTQTLFFVTIPRSGHHLMAKWLDHYHGGCLRHFERSKFYRWSMSLRDLRRRYDLVLNHDLGIRKNWIHARWNSFPRRRDLSYVIQVRHPLLSLVSEFALHEEQALGRAGERDEWLRFAEEGLRYRRRFWEKWLKPKPLPRQLVLSYEALQRDPRETLAKALKHWRPDMRVDEKRIEAALERFPPRPERRLEAFPHYDRSEFAAMLDRLGEDACRDLERRESLGMDLRLP